MTLTFASPKPPHPVTTSDQFCSLVYTLSNLYFVGCFYTRFSINFPSSTVQSSINPESALHPANFTIPYQVGSSAANSAFHSLLSSAYAPQAQEAWSTCGVAQNWGWYYLLGILPFVVRVVQNVRRYWDSKLPSQLFNVWNLYDLHSFYIHHLFQTGWEVRDGNGILRLLLLLEASKYVRLYDGQHITEIISQ